MALPNKKLKQFLTAIVPIQFFRGRKTGTGKVTPGYLLIGVQETNYMRTTGRVQFRNPANWKKELEKNAGSPGLLAVRLELEFHFQLGLAHQLAGGEHLHQYTLPHHQLS
jgi:hypothetical protein